MKQVKGGVTAAKGFEAASTAAGIKYKDRTDMALVYSQVPCVAAGTFTTNVVKAAPVKWDQQVVKSGAKAQAVVVNSGIANACTGAEGFGYCKDTADAAAKALNISADGVLIGSTGVIGKQIPIDKLTAGIEALAGKKNDTLENGTEAAKAIMTTDTFPKELAVTIEVGGKTVTIGGMAKGSGMIHPNMCTMLAFITTDAVITKDALQKALSEDVGDTYNMISVDGDTLRMIPLYCWQMVWQRTRRSHMEQKIIKILQKHYIRSTNILQRRLQETERVQPHYSKSRQLAVRA